MIGECKIHIKEQNYRELVKTEVKITMQLQQTYIKQWLC